MYNYANLTDNEFEELCKDILEVSLGTKLHTYTKGRDQGIDICDNPYTKGIVVQVKHYLSQNFSQCSAKIEAEIEKVNKLNPQRYYLCISARLTPGNVKTIYSWFEEYMEDTSSVITLQDIDSLLSKPEYEQVLHKNYKLWLESVDILNQIMNRNLFVDCEALFFDIEDAKKEFVKTTCYDKANDILDKKGMLLLLGAPGVGKTMTTKMLALEYAAKDYTIRYNSGNHLRDIKRSLSADLQKKELVILDDCFGQRYFEMKEEQRCKSAQESSLAWLKTIESKSIF